MGGKLSGSLLRNEIDLTAHDLNEDLVDERVIPPYLRSPVGREYPGLRLFYRLTFEEY